MNIFGKTCGCRPVLCSALLFIACQSSLPPIDPTSDAVEFESVWQYLKTLCIYQDSSLYSGRVPADPFSFGSPGDLLQSVEDTLKGGRYTRYLMPGEYSESAALFSKAAGNGSVFLDRLTDLTCLLTISTFFSETVYDEFRSLVPSAAQFPNMVIDLRGNGGGFIDMADSIIAAIVPTGTRYIMVRERDFDSAANKYVTIAWHPWITAPGRFPQFVGKRFAVLMDGLTASASEIAVSALYEGTKAALVGSRSYGKGIGQERVPRRNRPWLLISTMQLKGVSDRIGDYHRNGIAPDSIPAVFVHEADSANLSDRLRTVFYALKRLEPAATPKSMRVPASRPIALGKTAEPVGLKTIDIKEYNLPVPRR